MILLDAVYINNGGGYLLLELLLAALDGRTDVKVLLDSRVEFFPWRLDVVKVAAGELNRLRFYREHRAAFTKVFCFGNIPPPIRLDCPVKTYLHNRLLLTLPGGFNRSSIALRFKGLYLRFRRNNTDEWGVQTSTMADALCSALGVRGDRVRVWPFYSEGRYIDLKDTPGRMNDTFGYVSLPHLYKNHAALLDAWELLAAAGLTPELHLTIPAEHSLAARVDSLKAAGLRLVNHGFCDPRAIYSVCRYQVYPSSTESFGLGLIEAAEAGCAILAPDFPYVHAVVAPSLTWSPAGGSAAIATAVETVLAQPPPPSRLRVENKLQDIIHFLTE